MDQDPSALLSSDEFEAELRAIGVARYHNLHRFHRRLHGGGCSKAEVQAWALNRYYYQAMIPVKDAVILARMREPAHRREWRRRLEDHDGVREGEGGIERWLRLTDALGFSRDDVRSECGLLPATRFAVDAYVNFCRDKSLLEAVASSLTELFSPAIIAERMSGMLAHYDFIDAEALAYFSQRPPQAARDSDFALNFVKTHATTRADQDRVLAALVFKTDVLWAQLDALWSAYVDGAVPPGAWVPP